MNELSDGVTELLPDLRRYAMRLTQKAVEAEDLVQDCVEQALRKSHLYRPGTNLKAWLATIMRNHFFNQRRRDRVARRYVAQLERGAGQGEPPVQLTRVFLGQTISAVAELDPEDAQTIRVLCIDEQPHGCSASALGIGIGASKSRLLRARKQLLRRLDLDKSAARQRDVA